MKIAILESVLLLMISPVLAQPVLSKRDPYHTPGAAAPAGPIDQIVFKHLDDLKIKPARVCSDQVFLRRAYLDIIGMLPSLEMTRSFIEGKKPNKREILVNYLLDRKEFADYWAMKWCDLLRVKSEFPINLWPNGSQAYYQWIWTSIRENMPYDQFARQLLTSSGSNFRVPPVNFYRALQSNDPPSISRAVALTFMGCRAEKWQKDRLANMSLFFSFVGYKSTAEWKEQIIYFDSVKAAKDLKLRQKAIFPDGKSVELPPGRDPREIFADWLIDSRNPWFARAIVNRVWYWLMGRGIIDPADDIGSDSKPVNPELLKYLERELIKSKYDLKYLFRLILNSTTYQLSSVPVTDTQQARANFASYTIRRLDAEVLADALCQITGTNENYSSLIPEPFTFIPDDQRSVLLPDGSITSSFLEMFGRPARDTGLLEERNNSPSAAQKLHMLNSSHVRNKIEKSSRLKELIRASGRKPLEMITTLYLSILSRYPTRQEVEIISKYSKSRGQAWTAKRQAVVDIIWALVNSTEFLYRH